MSVYFWLLGSHPTPQLWPISLQRKSLTENPQLCWLRLLLPSFQVTKKTKKISFLLTLKGYISRSVAGSFDNEAIAIFALLLTFFLWVKSVKTGSLYWSALCALAYFYMVSAWGGYVFIINLIPLHVLALLFTGRYSHRLYIAYCTVYTLGSMLAMQIPFVGFQHVQSSEHMVAMVTTFLPFSSKFNREHLFFFNYGLALNGSDQPLETKSTLDSGELQFQPLSFPH